MNFGSRGVAKVGRGGYVLTLRKNDQVWMLGSDKQRAAQSGAQHIGRKQLDSGTSRTPLDPAQNRCRWCIAHRSGKVRRLTACRWLHSSATCLR